MLVVAIDWKGLSDLGATLGAVAAVSSEVSRPALLMHSFFFGVDGGADGGGARRLSAGGPTDCACGSTATVLAPLAVAAGPPY